MKRGNGYFSQYRGFRREIYVLFFGRVVTSLGSMVWPVMTLILNQKMGMDAERIAVVMVLASALMLPANLLGGKLADRFDKKRNIIFFDTVSVACELLAAALPLTGTTVVLFVGAGLCQSLEYPSYDALIADLTKTRDRDRAYSLQYLGSNLGLVLSPTIAGLLFKDYLWLSFLLSGCAIGLSTLLIAFLVRDTAPEPDEGAESVYQRAADDKSILAILRENPAIVVFMLAVSLYYSAYNQYSYLMPLDMGRVHGEQGAVIYGTVSSLNCIVVVAFTPLLTRLLRRLPDPGKMLLGMGLVGGGYGVFLSLLGRIPAYYAAMLLFTWGEISVTISEGPYLSSRIPASHRGRVNGVSMVLSGLIHAGVDLTVGRLYSRGGPTKGWLLVFRVLALAAALSVLLTVRDRDAYPMLYRKNASEEKNSEPAQ